MTGKPEARSVSVVIPAYNEEARIASSLDRVVPYLESRERPFEVLVVDDGSSDGTAGRAQNHPGPGVKVLRLPENRGKGAAVKTGVLASSQELVLICDADLSTPIEELGRLIPWIDQAPIVIASRQAEGARVERTLGRRFASWVFNATLTALRLCPGLRDTQCGFKLLEGDVARFLFARMEIDGFAFDIELLELARHYGIEVREVGVVWRDSSESAVRFLRDTPRMLADAWSLKRRISALPAPSPSEAPRAGQRRPSADSR
ncbi:MAG: glycosyltransferase family 2 protein [Acidobacteria bacterium]|nr:glycosyltransferase family 2 protein [Acidobacteriota bacterium]